MAGTLTAPENGSNPTAPASGYRVLYAKSDGWYDENSSGTATKLGASISGAFALTDDENISITANADNQAVASTSQVIRFSPSAAWNLTGLTGGSDGRVLLLHNVGSFALTLKDESASSTAANRFALYADITLQTDTGVLIQYDSTSSRWRAINLASTGGSGMTSFTVAGDGGSPQTITDGNTLTVSGGTMLTATASATDTITIDHDTSGVAAATYGAAATVPVIIVNGTGHITSATDTAIAISAAAVTSGTLAVARGGTNSGTTLNNNRVMQSSAGAIVEAAAITASKALVSDTNGIPVAATTTTTELNYLSGVTAPTGSGALVLGTSPSLATPALGTPSALVLTNATGLPVAGGGTGVATLTAYAPIFGGTTGTGAVQSGTVGTSGQVLTSNGAGALPTFQSVIAGSVTDITANIALSGDISPASIGSSQNDYNPTGLSTASTLRLTSSAAYNITGLQGGADGRLIIVHNIGSFTITLKDENASSSAANRFALVNDLVLNTDQSCILQYDSTTARWRVFSQQNNSYACIVDQKATTTEGGTFTTGAWRTRDLNTKQADTDGIVSIASNQFTLQAGTYRILAIVPAYKVNTHQAKLRNITAGSNSIIGTNVYTDNGAFIVNHSFISGEVTITSATVFEIQHYCQTTQATSGFGFAGSSSGEVEIYTVVHIWKK